MVNIIGTIDKIVVSVVIRIGRRRIQPLSISASFSGIVSFSWFVVSTYKIPLFTTIPTNIRIPIKEVIFNVEFVINSRKKEPIKLNGILNITIKEKLGDSNCIAITKKIKNTAVAIAVPIAVNSSIIISFIIFSVSATPSGNVASPTASWIALCAVKRASFVVYAVIAT